MPEIDTVIALPAAADTYVRGGVDSLNNFGGDASLAIKFSGVGAANTREGYLKFDISTVNGSLKQAVLKLYAIYDLTQPTVTIPVLSHTISLVKDDSWGGLTLTYATRPRSGTPGASRRITSAYVPTGARTFDVENSAGLAVGDTIEVIRTPNDAWISALDMAQYGFHLFCRPGAESPTPKSWGRFDSLTVPKILW